MGERRREEAKGASTVAVSSEKWRKQRGRCREVGAADLIAIGRGGIMIKCEGFGVLLY